MRKASLLDYAAEFMRCQYISDLHYLSPYQRCVLAAHIERIDAEQHSLFEWNDALEYLSGRDAQNTVSMAKAKLLQALRRI